MAQQDQLTQGQGVLTKGAQMTEAAKADLNKISDNLDQQLLVLNTHWQGGGGSAFQSLKQEWHEKQKKIIGILDQFEASLRGSESRTTNTDENQNASMTNLTNKLGEVRA